MSLVLSTVLTGYNLSVLNNNFTTVAAYINGNVLLTSGGQNVMSQNLDMNSNAILNATTDESDTGSLVTVGFLSANYLPLAGGTLLGILNAGGYTVTNLTAPVNPTDAVRYEDLQAEQSARTAADIALQAEISGGAPLTASAFSPISWHAQVVPNSVAIPANVNAWSFGPTITIASGQTVTIGTGSFWTIANGEVNT